MKNYQTPRLNIVMIEFSDILTTSTYEDCGKLGLIGKSEEDKVYF